MKTEKRTIMTTIRFRPATKDLLRKLSIIYDRTASDTIEQLIIAEANRKDIIEKKGL